MGVLYEYLNITEAGESVWNNARDVILTKLKKHIGKIILQNVNINNFFPFH